MKIISITFILTLLVLFTNAAGFKDQRLLEKPVSFEVVLDSSIHSRVVFIVYQNSLYDTDTYAADTKEIEATAHHGNTYLFDLGLQQKPMYFSLFLRNGPAVTVALSQYFFEPGDKVKMNIKPVPFPRNFMFSFEGRGSEKYTCKSEIRNADSFGTDRSLNTITRDNRYNKDNRNIKSVDLKLQMHKKYESQLSAYAFQLLNADLIGAYGESIASGFNSFMKDCLAKQDTAGFKQLAADWLRFKFDYGQDIPANVLADSKDYAYYMLERAKNDDLVKSGKMDYKGYYDFIKKTSNPLLRDKMLAIFFIKSWNRINVGQAEMLKDALAIVGDKYKAKLQEFERGHIGNKAYNFSLTNVDGDKVTLGDFKGKIVFIDFWFTGCGACKKYYQSVLDDVEKIYSSNKNIVFMTVCVDQDKEKWLNSVKSGQYTSTDIVNLYTEGQDAQHPLIKYYNIMGYPHPMLIGRKGEIIKFTGRELRVKETLIAEIDKALQAPSK